MDETEAPSYRLAVDGILSPSGGGVRITPVAVGQAHVTWYDVEGRELLTHVVELGEDPLLVMRPLPVPPGSMVVVVDDAGRVGGAVVP